MDYFSVNILKAIIESVVRALGKSPTITKEFYQNFQILVGYNDKGQLLIGDNDYLSSSGVNTEMKSNVDLERYLKDIESMVKILNQGNLMKKKDKEKDEWESVDLLYSVGKTGKAIKGQAIIEAEGTAKKIQGEIEKVLAHLEKRRIKVIKIEFSYKGLGKKIVPCLNLLLNRLEYFDEIKRGTIMIKEWGNFVSGVVKGIEAAYKDLMKNYDNLKDKNEDKGYVNMLTSKRNEIENKISILNKI